MTWRSARDMVSVASNAQSNSLVFFGAIALEEALVWVTAPQDKVRNGNTLGGYGMLRHEAHHTSKSLHGVLMGGSTIQGKDAVEGFEQTGDTA